MPRLSIDVTPEQHKAIKAEALLQDKTIRDFALERLLPGHTQGEGFPFTNQETLSDSSSWEEKLKEHLREAIEGETVQTSVEELMAEAHERMKTLNKAA